ncbi:AAA family ATPase [Rhizobium beringeri]
MRNTNTRRQLRCSGRIRMRGSSSYTRVGDALAEVDDRYDVVVIDCPPQLGYLTLTALTAATSVLITVHPQMLDIMSMSNSCSCSAAFSRALKPSA